CKHAVAVCFQYQQDIGIREKDYIEEWLNRVERLAPKKLSEQERLDSEFFLVYRIFETPYGDDINLYKSKLLKSGKVNRGAKIAIYNTPYNCRDYSDVRDKAFLPKLSSMADIRGNYKFFAQNGYHVLHECLKTGRCFFKDSVTPLTKASEKIPYEIKWKKAKEKMFRLSFQSKIKDCFIVPTQPITLIDKKNNLLYDLDSNIEYDLLQQILKAPEIPSNQVNNVYQTLLKNFNQLELEIPATYKLKQIKPKPIPSLDIFYNSDEIAKDAYYLELNFLYDEHKIKPFPRQEKYSIYTENSKIEVVRDLQVEQAAIDTLNAFGFKAKTTNLDLSESNLTLSIAGETNQQEALKKWQEFLEVHVESLKSQGWQLDFHEDFNLEFNLDSYVEVESESNNDWFSLSFNVRFGDKSYPLAPLVSSILEEFDDVEQLPEKLFVECEQAQYVELKTKEIQPVLKTLFELFDRKQADESLKISSFDAHMLADMDDLVQWKGNKEILKLSKKLKDFAGIQHVKPPKALKLELRDYQQQGLNWLQFLHEFKFSGILADDMGLGKTAQTLAHLSKLKELGKLNKPVLIVVPTSLIANWRNEVKKFTPNLKLITLYGIERKDKFVKVNDYDLILTTYNLVGNDVEVHQKRKHSYVVLDEAQKIKNPKTKMARVICTLKSDYRLALTGTPIENHLGELWSIFNFLMPGFLHNQKLFNEYYRKPIENEFDSQMQKQLNKRIKPFVLRRTKEDVLTELPTKTEIIKLTQFENKQSKLYETIRIAMQKKVRDAVAKKGVNRSHIHILDALLKLRQVCCDPSLLKLKEAKNIKESAKLELFLDLIDELMEEGRKVLVFSQFTSMLAILEREIKKKNISYVKLTGASTKRDKIIDKFTQGKADVFLISLKAGGVGLNLVEADTVIHYDPWWNPAVENQATDRTHRIGQDKKVFVYKLIIENSIEQKIIELQQKKKALQDGIYDNGNKLEDKKFDGKDLMDLLQS
ncbi:MAG TPA: DEAD/DEAH box helicase, partial [Saprospiraceae bacterium]|nr:DEAD/DEAH box helicase [Saprospiraceae bacterium]